MLDNLRFVMRGVARRDIVPGLTHFRISNGTCTGFNGTITLSAPVDIGFDCAPVASRFVRALAACEDSIVLTQESEARIIVRSGKFSTAVPCVALNTVPISVPEGKQYSTPQSFLTAMRVLAPFISRDASRPWSCGVMLDGLSAYATNNIALVEYWLGVQSPFRVNVPSSAVDELLTLNEEVASVQLSESSVTFHYPDGRWVKSQLLTDSWPNMAGALASWSNVGCIPVSDELRKAVATLKAFGDKKDLRLYLRQGNLATTPNGTLEDGAVVEIAGLPERGCYHTGFLNEVLAACTHINFAAYPELTPFCGVNLRGGIIGIRYAT